jgi:protoporphyrinogen IX oxidase
MSDFLLNNYLWFKSFHVIMSIAWMAGLFYLPRLFVYHTQTSPGSSEYARFVTMEKKLLDIIMLPAAVTTWGFGILNAWEMDYWLEGWFVAKLALAVLMTAVHTMNAFWAERFAQGRNVHSERFYRIWNEAPTFLMIGIVILAIVKP